MSPSTPPRTGRWTADDHADNARRIERANDIALVDAVVGRLARMVRVSPRALQSSLSRLLNARIDAAVAASSPRLADQLRHADDVASIRSAILDMILDDLVEIISEFTSKGNKHDSRTKRPR